MIVAIDATGVKALFLRCRANTTQRVALIGHASAGSLLLCSSFKKLEHIFVCGFTGLLMHSTHCDNKFAQPGPVLPFVGCTELVKKAGATLPAVAVKVPHLEYQSTVLF